VGRPDLARVSRAGWGALALGVYLLLLGIVLGSFLLALWPTVEAFTSTTTPSELSVRWFAAEFSISAEAALLLLVLVFGALGAYIHTVTSFVDYVGNRRLTSSWTWWYFLRPFIGTALALVFYVAIRGGFFAQEAQTGDINPFGMAALAGLAGLFSKQATDKLKEVFDTLFRTAEGVDAHRQDPLANPVPTLDSIQPASIKADDQPPVLTLRGDHFVRNSTVLLDGTPIRPKYLSPTELLVEVPADGRPAPGTVNVTVRNPEPGGGVSEPVPVELTESPGA
jgi:IPT/TIG domain